MKIIVPPIKSHGIKTKLVPWIMDVAPKVSGRWVEPFVDIVNKSEPRLGKFG